MKLGTACRDIREEALSAGFHIRFKSEIRNKGERMMKQFCWQSVILFLIITGSCLPYAAGSDIPDTRLDEEFRWLQAEAEAGVVTVATKTRMTVEDAPSIVSVITGEEIRNMGARNLADVMRTVPGFDPVCNSESFPRIYIRGMASQGTNKSIKIMIDGHAMQPMRADDFERLPVAGISKIEIIRGPGSALYGTGAFLGVINMVTYKGGEKPSQVSLEYGSFDTVKPRAEFSYRKDDLNAYLYAEYYKTDGYDAKIGADAAATAPVLPDFGPLYVASDSREMTNDSSHYALRTRIAYKDFYFSGFVQKSDNKCPVGVFDVLTDEDDIEQLYSYAEAGFTLPLNDRGSLLMKMYYDYNDYKILYEILPEETAEKHTGFPPDEGLYQGPEGKYTVLGGEITGNYELRPGIHLTGGTAYEHIRHYDLGVYSNHNSTRAPLELDGKTYSAFPPYERFPGGLTNIWDKGVGYEQADSDIFALYGQGTLDMKSLFALEDRLKTLSFTAGLRYDHYRDKGDETGVSAFSSVNPRLGFAYAPKEDLWFKVLYGEAFRAPSLTELYSRGNAYIKYNKDLKPEKISTAEALVGYRFAKNITASLTGFYVRAKDLVQSISEEGIYRFRNIGKTESVGAEFEFKAGFGKNRYAFVNFTWQDVKDVTNKKIEGTDLKQDDFSLGESPEFYGNIGVNYGVTENIIANVTLNYLGERERSGEKIWDGEKLVLEDQRDPVDEYWLLNASLTFRDFLAKGLEFQISGFNLLDEDYRSPDLYLSIADDIPSPGRSIIGRISYAF
jgi:iron complex outermembrane receptor protein